MGGSGADGLSAGAAEVEEVADTWASAEECGYVDGAPCVSNYVVGKWCGGYPAVGELDGVVIVGVKFVG